MILILAAIESTERESVCPLTDVREERRHTRRTDFLNADVMYTKLYSVCEPAYFVDIFFHQLNKMDLRLAKWWIIS